MEASDGDVSVSCQSGSKHLAEHQANVSGSVVQPLPQPVSPTSEERARHEVDHCPYQAWCRSCVAGRGKADAHFAQQGDESGVACVACDYAFMGEKVEDDAMSQNCLPILVHKFFKDWWVTGHVVRRKGRRSVGSEDSCT